MPRIVAIGTLREDITVCYDFSTPLLIMEKKLSKVQRTIGGSVFNTCAFWAKEYKQYEVTLCSNNYKYLLSRIRGTSCEFGLKVCTPDQVIDDSPLSLIGVKADGEKQILSYDVAMSNRVLPLFEKEAEDAEIVYTSFYEIDNSNYTQISNIYSRRLEKQQTTVIDLCPLIADVGEKAIREILSNVRVLLGNKQEYEQLLKVLKLSTVQDVMNEFPSLTEVWVKKDRRGAEVFIKDLYGRAFSLSEKAIKLAGKVKNTTGCGDVFNAVVIAEKGLNYDYAQVLKRAVEKSGLIASGGLPWN